MADRRYDLVLSFYIWNWIYRGKSC